MRGLGYWQPGACCRDTLNVVRLAVWGALPKLHSGIQVECSMCMPPPPSALSQPSNTWVGVTWAACRPPAGIYMPPSLK